MRASEARAWIVVLLIAAAATPARAWQDPLQAWRVDGYLQLLQVDRPGAGRPPVGNLDAYGDAAGGYDRDGLYGRALDVRLSGPLGWEGMSAAMETQTDFNATSLADLYVQWAGSLGTLRLGQEYLPFGIEEQVSKADLPGIQRSLAYGFENYGHIQPWGLELLNQRGLGLRWDQAQALGGGARAGWSAAAQDFSGGQYLNALGGVARAEVGWSAGPAAARAGYSLELGRGLLVTPPATFSPLGAPQGAAEVPSADLSGKGVVLTWGPDLGADLGPLHARAESALQALHNALRGGGKITVWLDADPLLTAWGLPLGWTGAGVYAAWDQACSSFGDGIHAANALVRSNALGVRLPLGWSGASLKVELLTVTSDTWGGVLPDGRIVQAQGQLKF